MRPQVKTDERKSLVDVGDSDPSDNRFLASMEVRPGRQMYVGVNAFGDLCGEGVFGPALGCVSGGHVAIHASPSVLRGDLRLIARDPGPAHPVLCACPDLPDVWRHP